MSLPIISVVIPSFNHGNFLPEAVQSVLAQTLEAIEVIIVDDGSADNSVEFIKSIEDKRVRSIFLQQNHGACHAINTGIIESKSALIAICNSDDQWINTKLASQLEILQKNQALGAVLTDLEFIDESGKKLAKAESGSFDLFIPENRSKANWLKYLVENDNCLCHPSLLIKREVYDRCGLYDNRYRQLPDYDMWLKVVEHYEIFIMPEKAVLYRLHSNNASKPSADNHIRGFNERAMIIEQCFNRIGAECFANAFGTKKSLNDKNFSLPLEKVLYLVTRTTATEYMYRNIGARLLYQFLTYSENAIHFLEAYNMPSNSYHIIMGLSSPWLDIQPRGYLATTEKDFLQCIYPESEFDVVIKRWQKEFEIEKLNKELIAEKTQTEQLNKLLNSEKSQTEQLNKLLDSEKSQTEQLNKLLDSEKSQTEQLNKLLNSEKFQTEQLVKLLDTQKSQTEHLTEMLTTEKSENAKSKNRIDALQLELINLLNSKSWQITKPLRVPRQFLRQFLAGITIKPQ